MGGSRNDHCDGKGNITKSDVAWQHNGKDY